MHTDKSYACRVDQKFTEAGLNCTQVSYVDGEGPPANWRDIPCHLLTGGNTGIETETQAMHQAHRYVSNLVESAREGEKLVMGVCQGSQMLAAALGGKDCVGPSPNGLEIGLADIEFVATEEHPSPRSPMVAPEFHYHEVKPEFLDRSGAKLLFSNDHSPIQGYQVDERIIAYQFHPEMSDEDTDLTIRDNATLLKSFDRCPSQLKQGVAARRGALSPSLFQNAILNPIQSHLQGAIEPQQRIAVDLLASTIGMDVLASCGPVESGPAIGLQ